MIIHPSLEALISILFTSLSTTRKLETENWRITCLKKNAYNLIYETFNEHKYSDSAPSSHCVVPINDIRGIDSMVYAKGEKVLRCKLAAVYRLIELYGWTQGIYNHVTVR